MILLDTDHLSVFTDERDPRHMLLNTRMETAADQIGCTIVSVEEVLRGWLAIIHRLRDVPANSEKGFHFASYWTVGKVHASDQQQTRMKLP